MDIFKHTEFWLFLSVAAAANLLFAGIIIRNMIRNRPKLSYVLKTVDGKRQIYNHITRVKVYRQVTRIQGPNSDVIVNHDNLKRLDRVLPGGTIKTEGNVF